MSETNPSNRDPKDMIDPAHPVPFDADDVEVDDDEVDQDSEPTMTAPDGERPDGKDLGQG